MVQCFELKENIQLLSFCKCFFHQSTTSVSQVTAVSSAELCLAVPLTGMAWLMVMYLGSEEI